MLKNNEIDSWKVTEFTIAEIFKFLSFVISLEKARFKNSPVLQKTSIYRELTREAILKYLTLPSWT